MNFRYAPIIVAVLMAITVLVPFYYTDGDLESLTGAKIGGHFTLDSHGGPISTEALTTDLFLIYFGYTYCPDICPTELARMTAILNGLGEDAEEISPLFVTIDPTRDSIVTVTEYAKIFHPRIIGLSGTESQIEALQKKYQVYAQKTGEEEDYLVDHTSRIYLMNSSARLLALFSMDTPVEKMIEQTKNFL